MEIVYLHNKDIDRVLWDSCISKSNCNLIYGQSFFLDAMVPGWEAIVINNYEAVIPLPVKIKFGIRYIYYAAFTQQLGLFSTRDNISFSAVLTFLKKHIKYGHLFLNHCNTFFNETEARTNFILPLDKPYEEIYSNYKNDLKKNLKLTKINTWKYSKNLEIEKAIKMYKDHYTQRHSNVKDADYMNLQNFCNKILIENKVITRAVINDENEILSIALFFLHNNRIYNILNTTTENGRTNSANHFLLNEVIKEFANSNYIFDFEGSDLPGVKSFYEKFSPVNEPYFIYKYNNLSFPLKLFKK